MLPEEKIRKWIGHDFQQRRNNGGKLNQFIHFDRNFDQNKSKPNDSSRGQSPAAAANLAAVFKTSHNILGSGLRVIKRKFQNRILEIPGARWKGNHRRRTSKSCFQKN